MGTSPGCELKLALSTEGRERLKTAADHPILVRGRFHKQRNLHTRRVLGDSKTSRSPHLQARIFKLYREAVMGFSHIPSPGYAQHQVYISRLYSLLLGAGKSSRTYILRAGEEGRSLQVPWVQLMGPVVTMSSFLMTSSNSREMFQLWDRFYPREKHSETVFF